MSPFFSHTLMRIAPRAPRAVQPTFVLIDSPHRNLEPRSRPSARSAARAAGGHCCSSDSSGYLGASYPERRMTQPFEGHVGRTYADSKSWWPPRQTAPAGAPNVVIVLLDDVG